MPKVGSHKLNGHANVATEALKLEAAGFSVVPVNGKKPTEAGWAQKRFSADQLESKLKGSKLGIAVEWSQSDLIDVECDTAEAETALLGMFDGEIPETPTWQSERGKHRLFRRPEGLPKKAKIELDGVEFRIANGSAALSVVPPSGGRKWLPGLSLDEVEPAELPESIVARLRAPAPKVEPTAEGRVAEGKRNDTLFAKACALRDLKLPPETILATLLDLNARLCDPPLPDSEIQSIVKSVTTQGKPSDNLVKLLLSEMELWHDENGDPFATVSQEGHRENWKIGKRIRAFRRWLSKRCYDVTGGVLSDKDLGELCALLEGRACFDGPGFAVHRRTGEHDGTLYLDLCDDAWRAVEIDGTGWRVVSDPPVKFFRARAMQSLPEPEKPKASLHTLLSPYLNLRPSHWPLVAAFLTASLRPRGPYPILKLLGEQGSSKSTTARVIRSVVDPNAAPLRAETKATRDLMIAANNSWVICFDNLSVIDGEMSDALCRLSTGGGFSTRTLYTDEDETIFDAMRPVILTSIEDIGSRSDLLERSLIVDLPTIPKESRRPEKDFWAGFEKARPEILGALLDVVCAGMRRLPEVEANPPADLPRMADFAMWGIAIESALDLDPGAFMESYVANRESATHLILESQPLIAALLNYLAKNVWSEKTAAGWLETLNVMFPDGGKQPGWPKSPRVLSAILKRVAPNLREIGVTAVQDTRGGGNDKEKVWRIESSIPAKKTKPKPKSAKPKSGLVKSLPKGVE